MADDDRRSIPAKRLHGTQVSAVLNSAEVDSGATVELLVDPAQLFMQATEQTRMAICVTDPSQADQPIVYANEAFVTLTGYDRAEIIGRNCRFLQGSETDPAALQRIRDALDARRVTVVDILNYRKDGTPFWNALHIGPIYGENGELRYFYGSQWDVTEIFRQREETARAKQVAEELQHRTGNLFAVMSSIVRMSARGETDVEALADKIERRLGALASAHRVSIAAGASEGVQSDLRDLVDAVVKPYRNEDNSRISVNGERLQLPPDVITPVGLTLHELATNAVKYGSLADDAGTVTVEWGEGDGTLSIRWIERGGPEVASDADGKPIGTGTGSRIVSGILSGIDATIERKFEPQGLTATIRMPRDFVQRTG